MCHLDPFLVQVDPETGDNWDFNSDSAFVWPISVSGWPETSKVGILTRILSQFDPYLGQIDPKTDYNWIITRIMRSSVPFLGQDSADSARIMRHFDQLCHFDTGLGRTDPEMGQTTMGGFRSNLTGMF